LGRFHEKCRAAEAPWQAGPLRGKKSSPHARGGASAVGSVSGPSWKHSATDEMRRFRSFARPRRDRRAAPNRTFRTSNRTSDEAPPVQRPSAGSRRSIIEASNPMGDLGRRRHLRLDGGSPSRRCQRRRENASARRVKITEELEPAADARDSLRQLHVKLSFPVSINEPAFPSCLGITQATARSRATQRQSVLGRWAVCVAAGANSDKASGSQSPRKQAVFHPLSPRLLIIATPLQAGWSIPTALQPSQTTLWQGPPRRPQRQ
jgi:hypothetical protein